MNVANGKVKPGEKTVVDPVAVEIISKSGVKTVVLDIRNLENLEKAIEGYDFTGTVIQ